MKAMLLAAGRGERLRPLTDHTPKPLLEVGGRTLIEWQLLRLKRAGITDFVINLAHLGAQITRHLGDGGRYGVSIAYSPEPAGALDTGGGIRQALALLGSEPFVVANADVWLEFDYARLPPLGEDLAHLVLVPNPLHHRAGDFALSGRRVGNAGDTMLTFAGVALYAAALFADSPPGRFPLAPLLRAAADAGRIGGSRCEDCWIDVGTPTRLEEARHRAAYLTKRGETF